MSDHFAGSDCTQPHDPMAPVGGGEEMSSFVSVRDVKQDVVSKCTPLPVTDGIKGGVECTGFFDVEKLIFIHKKILFLEKKLPFQILIIHLDP